MINAIDLPEADPTDALCIVPVYDEPFESLDEMLELESGRQHAFVFVFNAPENGRSDALHRTRGCLAQFIAQRALQSRDGRLWYNLSNKAQLLWVLDFCQPGELICPKKGVGLARKLGMDFALRLCLSQSHKGAEIPHWLHSCDADVTLPSGYFDIPVPLPEQQACLYPISHQADPDLELAMQLYDLRLDYYVEQLEKAGSPYAFQTVGSAIALRPCAYARVRGVPKKAAGEDFYLLNKLAKLGSGTGRSIVTLNEPVLRVQGRSSQRVPFGTGPALLDISRLEAPIYQYLYYEPQIFCRLKGVLDVARDFDEGTYAAFSVRLKDKFDRPVADLVVSALETLGVGGFFTHWSKQTHRQRFWVLFCTWFDAFRTLKFVHAMRDRDCPSLNIERLRQQSDLLSQGLGARINAILRQHG